MTMVAKVDRGDPRADRWQLPAPATRLDLPEWVARVYPHQVRAVDEVVHAFEGGARVVQLDAPTGAGKGLIADLVRRRLGVSRSLYVCTTKTLQRQIRDTFPYSKTLMGRANYTPLGISSRERDGYGTANPFQVTCADCDASGGETAADKTCSYCPWVEECPYLVARQEAMQAPLGVVNTAYLLAAANHTKFDKQSLIIADECDLLEGQKLDYIELRVPARLVDKMGLEVPKKGSHMTTIRSWLEDELLVEVKRAVGVMAGEMQRGRGGLEVRREIKRLKRLQEDVQRVVDRPDGWVREGDEEEGSGRRGASDGLVLKPVSVEDMGEKVLWRHADRWLLMSGTTVSAQQQADVLGLEAADIAWEVVSVPMLFPVANRPVVYAPLATMTRSGQADGALDKVLVGIERILARHAGQNVLIHSHTYKLAEAISAHIKQMEERYKVLTYTSAWTRDKALDQFKAAAGKGGAVLVAASMDRGVDLPYDLCRAMVLVKMPFASLGSRQVSERLRTPGGSVWYSVDVTRTIMQMTGRGVRAMDDACTTYILDATFGKVLKDGKRLGLFPEWWLESLEMARMREFI